MKQTSTSPPPANFQLEHMDGSPGANLRSRRLREDLDESVEVDDALEDYIDRSRQGGATRDNVRTLDESPGQARRQRQTTQESQQVLVCRIKCTAAATVAFAMLLLMLLQCLFCVVIVVAAAAVVVVVLL